MTEIARVRDRSGPWSVGIVGAGIVGLATAKVLQSRGIEFEIFEDGAPGGGQSRGNSRLCLRQSADPRIFRLMAAGVSRWEQWQRELKVELISPRGVVSFDGAHHSRTDGSGRDGPRDLTGPEVVDLLPILGRDTRPATIDPRSGVIWARAAIGSLLGQVGRDLIPARVDRLEVLADGRVMVGAGPIERIHDAVVVAAGGSTVGLAELTGVEIPMVHRAKITTTHRVKPPVAGSRLPGFRGLSCRGETGSGMPDRSGEAYTVGLNRDLEADADGSFHPGEVEHLAHTTAAWVAEVIPGLVSEPASVSADWAFGVPWGVDGIGIWRNGPVLFPAGMKMFGLAPVVGEVLADAAEGKPVLKEFRPENRLGAVPLLADSAPRGLSG